MNQISRDQQPMQRGGVSPAPRRRQAPDLKGYLPQRHPNYAAPPPPPTGSAPENLGPATAKGITAKFSVAAGLLFGGFVIAAIAMFLPWVTVTANSPLGGSLYQVDASPFKGGWIFAVLLVIAGAAWLAWPTVSGVQMSVQRLAGLSAVVCLLIGCFLIGFVDYVSGVAEKQKVTADSGEALTGLGAGVDVSMGFGLLLYTAAVVAIVVGVVRVWINRSKAS